SLDLVGQNSAIFDLPPFGDVRLYQDAQGNPGTLSFAVEIVPAPASAALLGLGGLAATRRRR
ncbi:MAG: PEP-CTERM sorting domain-containing protein, partial [Planctomycetota bacterium]